MADMSIRIDAEINVEPAVMDLLIPELPAEPADSRAKRIVALQTSSLK